MSPLTSPLVSLQTPVRPTPLPFAGTAHPGLTGSAHRDQHKGDARCERPQDRARAAVAYHHVAAPKQSWEVDPTLDVNALGVQAMKVARQPGAASRHRDVETGRLLFAVARQRHEPHATAAFPQRQCSSGDWPTDFRRVDLVSG